MAKNLSNELRRDSVEQRRQVVSRLDIHALPNLYHIRTADSQIRRKPATLWKSQAIVGEEVGRFADGKPEVVVGSRAAVQLLHLWHFLHVPSRIFNAKLEIGVLLQKVVDDAKRVPQDRVGVFCVRCLRSSALISVTIPYGRV